ncbi:Mitochondrial import inner membrane translocase subunit tim22 [Allomyces javanicus]|nr:Mitochondrial import inner membrane translocase subunit tim22 [Allomyces javanicus]
MNNPMSGPMQEQQMMLNEFMDSCPFKVVTSGVMGFAFGGIFGIFMSSIDFHSTSQMLDKPMREQLRLMRKDMYKRMTGSARTFGQIGAIYSGTECVVESYRAKTDIWNSVTAGCLTGGTLALRAGPTAAVGGCVSFAAFSAAIDWYMKEREVD